MRTTSPASSDPALEPVRARLLRDATAEARTLLAAADRDAAALIADAETKAAAILAEARRRGAADAESAREAVRARSRRAARARELAARRECWEELGRQVVGGVEDLRRADSYPRLHAELSDCARRLLGPAVHITDAPGGGVVAEAPGRRLDLSLTECAQRALERLGAEVEELWTP